jgi:hypothetical protein
VTVATFTVERLVAMFTAARQFVDGPIVRTATGFDKRGAEIGPLDFIATMRSLVAAILLLLLLPATVVANGSWWATKTILDERTFTTVVGEALDSAALRDRLAGRATNIALDKLNRADRQTQQTVLALFGLAAIPDRHQLDLVLRPMVATALEAPAVRAERDRVMVAAHRFVLGGAEAGNEFVSIEGAWVVLDLSAVIEEVVATVDARLPGAGLADFTSQDASVVLAETDRLRTVGSALGLLATAGPALPIVLVAASVLIVALAHRRIRAIGLVGVTVMIAGLVCLTLAVLAGEYARGISDRAAVNGVAGSTYDAFATLLMEQSLVLAGGGMLVAALAWIVSWLRGSEY